jgi:hypothetical protein
MDCRCCFWLVIGEVDDVEIEEEEEEEDANEEEDMTEAASDTT